MHVSFASSRSPDKAVNEDFVVATPGDIVVLDGASVPPGLEVGCQHGTAWFVRQLGTRFLGLVEQDTEASLASSLARAIEDTRSLHASTCDLGHPETPSATVAAVRKRDANLEFLVLGDSTVLLDRGGQVRAITDTRMDSLATIHRSAIHQHPTGSAAANQGWAAYTKQLRHYRNRPHGFWIASNDPEAAHHALTGTIPCDGLRRAAVLTDGATRLVHLFRLLDWPHLLDILDQTGTDGLIHRTRAAEASDPVGQRWPRSNRHDDATAVLCRFGDADPHLSE